MGDVVFKADTFLAVMWCHVSLRIHSAAPEKHQCSGPHVVSPAALANSLALADASPRCGFTT